MTRQGNCFFLILGILLIIWLTAWGGCELIRKKTQDGLQDNPVPAAPERK